MQYLIYLENNEIKAKMFIKADEFDAFVASIPKADVLYKDNKVMVHNIPEMHREVFPVFLQSIQRQWDSRKVIMAPVDPSATPAVGNPDDTLELKAVSEPEQAVSTEVAPEPSEVNSADQPLAAAAPKRTRKKKTDN